MRKEIVTANQRLINEIATFLKKGKFNLEKLDEAYKLCVSSTSKEIPELSFIFSNEFGYGITDSSDCGKNSSWDVFVKSIKDYVSNLLGFYRQIPTVVLKKDNNKMPSKACLFEALIATKMMQTKFKEKLSDYFSDSKEITLLDEKEYNSILSLLVLWETLCRNITNVTIESQMARYKQLETNLPKNIVNSIKNDFNEPILPAKQFAGIVRALIWKGTEEYFSENRHLIDLLKEKSGPIWELHLPINFTEINIKQSLVNLLKYCHEAPDVSNIVDSFPSQYQIFRSLNNFISNKFTVSCSSNSDWITLSDALYRISLGLSLIHI